MLTQTDNAFMGDPLLAPSPLATVCLAAEDWAAGTARSAHQLLARPDAGALPQQDEDEVRLLVCAEKYDHTVLDYSS